MGKRDIVIGLLLLSVLAAVVYFRQRSTEEEVVEPTTLSIESELEESFNLEIPEDVEKIELEDVSGGDAVALATKDFESGIFKHSVLADLADPEPGTFYQGWLTKGNRDSDEYEIVPTAKLTSAKGGYILEFESTTDYSDFDGVLITQEKNADLNPETKILEGSF